MAKLSESKGKSGESYDRVFGNKSMGVLFSKVQSTVIRSGNELEQILKRIVPVSQQTTLEALSENFTDIDKKSPVQVVFKPSRLNPDNANKSIQADILVVDNVKRRFSLVEVKDGYVFDTKKADGELASLRDITSWLAQEFPYRTEYYLCAFNQDNKEAIVQGAKKRFSIEHVMTGRELCERIGIDYDEICEIRKADQRENRLFFLHQLLTITEIRTEIIDLLGSIESSDE